MTYRNNTGHRRALVLWDTHWGEFRQNAAQLDGWALWTRAWAPHLYIGKLAGLSDSRCPFASDKDAELYVIMRGATGCKLHQIAVNLATKGEP
jgi:hypothetical protein